MTNPPASLTRGVVALMGSGELAATMVEVHKDLLSRRGRAARAVFLDTPAGFQPNVDLIAQKAAEFFQHHVQHALEIASLKSADAALTPAGQCALDVLRRADFVLIGPGSPTYALREWRNTPVPEILARRVETGGCLVAASAAALTVGRFTLPVYEIYKVGEPLHWAEGMNLLGRFGLDLVVVPHWNNAEGGTHDTRFCYMGQERFRKLESLLPGDVQILGLDEHTACIIDLERGEATVRGVGCITLRDREGDRKFSAGARIPLDVLKGKTCGPGDRPLEISGAGKETKEETPDRSFWDTVHGLEADFEQGLEQQVPRKSVRALLELDRFLWEAQQRGESPDFISQAREILRELLVALGEKLEAALRGQTPNALHAVLTEEVLKLREQYRNQGHWAEADAIRATLERAGLVLEDTRDGPRWRLDPRRGS